MHKALLVIPSLAYSSAAKQLVLLATHLPRDRFEVRVCSLQKEAPWHALLQEAQVDIESLGWQRWFDVHPWLRLRRLIQEFQPDTLHAWGQGALTACLLTCYRGRGRLFLHEPFPSRQRRLRTSRWLQYVGREVLARVVVRGPAEAEQCSVLGLPPEKVVALPPAVQFPESSTFSRSSFCQELGLPESVRLLAGVGPLEPYRGYRDAIWALDILQFLYDDLHLLLIGTGSEEPHLRRFAHIAQVDKRTHFLGERADVANVLTHADLVWIPSRTNAGINTALEAMSAGRPVIASQVPGLKEIVIDGETGLFIAPGDRAALARQSRVLLDHVEQGRRLGVAGQQRASHAFTVAGRIERFVQLLDEP